jgi:hypothetical protein
MSANLLGWQGILSVGARSSSPELSHMPGNMGTRLLVF